ncbi:MAG TPA: exodeoxyribonuclease VII large subunit [Pirellulales bacterium]|jgi:exodeoxyribonuclease VII large subunit|nr:exodeoxyribonuclease VII large subunit [Pirellulales bacterium]
MDAAATQLDRPQLPPVLTVSALTLLIKEVVEGSFPLVWVSGEISNFSRPQSGHCYLTLKDDQAQIRAVIWRGTAATIRCDLHDGLEVICRGHLDLYAPRGSYQLVVDELQPKGLGALEQALRRLREKLAAEGLFERGRKRPIPAFPRRIAVVTSPTGAAIRDFLQVLGRRWRGCDVLVVPVRVQGVGSADEIARAIATVNRLLTPIDVLVVARGGGSLEDLWAFNEEAVVRAIAGSRIPVVSGVGHEIDVTLADLVADLRALTPSEAAERVVPAIDDIRAKLRSRQQQMVAALRNRVGNERRRLESLADRRVVRKPFDRLHELGQQLDQWSARSERAIRQRLAQARQCATGMSARLESLSPLGVLSRGYTLTTRLDGRLIAASEELSVGDQIQTRFARGQVISRVESVGNADGAGAATADSQDWQNSKS